MDLKLVLKFQQYERIPVNLEQLDINKAFETGLDYSDNDRHIPNKLSNVSTVNTVCCELK